MKIKYLFRAFVVIFVIAPLFWSCIYYASKNPSEFLWFWGESEVFSERLALYRIGGSVCLYDRTTQKRTSPWVNVIFVPLKAHDSMTVYIAHGKRGYLNLKRQGSVEIKAKYDYAWQFSEGIAAVVEKGQLRFIQSKGEYAFRATTAYDRFSMSELDFIFNQGSCLFPGKDGIGLIDSKGEVVVEPVFANISAPADKCLRIVSTHTGKKGIFDSSFRLLVDTVYDRVEVVENRGIVVTKDYNQDLLDFRGQCLHDVDLYDAIYPLYKADVSVMEARDQLEMRTGYSVYSVDGRYGLYHDLTNKQITPALYDQISYHSPGLFVVHHGDFCALIDGQGLIVSHQNK